MTKQKEGRRCVNIDMDEEMQWQRGGEWLIGHSGDIDAGVPQRR